MLKTLSTRYTLGIISDAIHTPGRGLRKLLERENLLQYFKHCIFSDEAGASKPSPRVFEQAARKLKTPLSQIVHVGDRESNDIAGPLAMGMQAILYTGLIDRGSQNTQATVICRNFADLPEILQQLETKKPETGN
jgi:putative hydrolase of the HAD superfamily